MKFVNTDVRFLFFDGIKRYTVEYTFGLKKWFVFNEREQSNCIFQKEDKRRGLKDINTYQAEDVLREFLEA